MIKPSNNVLKIDEKSFEIQKHHKGDDKTVRRNARKLYEEHQIRIESLVVQALTDHNVVITEEEEFTDRCRYEVETNGIKCFVCDEVKLLMFWPIEFEAVRSDSVGENLVYKITQKWQKLY